MFVVSFQLKFFSFYLALNAKDVFLYFAPPLTMLQVLCSGSVGGEEKWKKQSWEKWVKGVTVVDRKSSKWWKLPISLLDGGHGSLSTLENVVSVFALLLTAYRPEQLSFLKNRDQAETALDSGQESASSNTRTRSYFHDASARSVYTVSEDWALLMICLYSL